MSTPDRIPAFIVTGFLGSGKTALLNGLLGQAGFADSAVIVNEFGEIGIDHLLVETAEENILLLDAGCLCCAVLGSLKETLVDLFRRRAQGLVPPFRRVLIETTGMADPGPILQSLMRDDLVTAFYRLAGLVCVVDAEQGAATLQRHAEARAQVAHADRLLLSKTDRTGGACPADLAQVLRRLNPTAERITACHGKIAAAQILGDERGSNGLPWLGGLVPERAPGDAQPHTGAIAAQSFLIEAPVTWSGLASWIDGMRSRFGEGLLRCKGILNVAGLERPVLLHGVGRVFDTTRLPAWPDDERRSRLVVIGSGMSRDDVAATLPWLQAAEGTQPLPDLFAAPVG